MTLTTQAAIAPLAAAAPASMVSTWAVPIIVALIAAGLLGYVRDGVKAWRDIKKRKTPEGRDSARVVAADESLLVVVKARDELENDNARLRLELQETRTRAAEDRAGWAAEKADMRQEIDTLSAKLRALLDEVEDLKTRHS